MHVFCAHVPAGEHAKSSVCVEGQSESVVHGLATQCPVGSHASSGPQPLVLVHAATHTPVMPVGEQVHAGAGPQTIGGEDAASPAQLASVEHGF